MEGPIREGTLRRLNESSAGKLGPVPTAATRVPGKPDTDGSKAHFPQRSSAEFIPDSSLDRTMDEAKLNLP